MKNLIILILLFVIGIYTVTFIGCDSRLISRMWQSKCAANTILAIITVGQDYPTRGRCSKIGDKWHIQAEYRPDNVWIPLQVLDWPPVTEGKIEFEGQDDPEKLHYMSGKHVLMEYWTRLKDLEDEQLYHETG